MGKKPTLESGTLAFETRACVPAHDGTRPVSTSLVGRPQRTMVIRNSRERAVILALVGFDSIKVQFSFRSMWGGHLGRMIGLS